MGKQYRNYKAERSGTAVPHNATIFFHPDYTVGAVIPTALP